MPRQTTIHIRNQYLKFSAAHFTVFSATQRERLHGHNFAVTADITTAVGDDGLCFDYNIMKTLLRGLCDSLDEYVLMPEHSPYLTIRTDKNHVHVHFNGEDMQFLLSDTQVLPIANVTAEELSFWIIGKMLEDDSVKRYAISAITLTVSSGYGQAASTHWSAEGGIQ